MKKLIYSLAFIVIGLVSCTTFDDAVRENYGEGPSIAINITNTTDSAFTFTVSPASGTLYYNFLIEEADEADPEVTADVLLRGGYGNKDNVTNATQVGTITKTFDAEPNTTYQIYAVASSDKGITGAVTVASVTTSDRYAPALVNDPFESVNDKKSVVVYFDQDLVRGTGDVSAIYYKEWDWENPVTVPTEDIEVTIEDNTAILSAPTTPDGAIVAFSWAAGAFTDAVGNRCASFTTVYNEEKDEFIGAFVENKKVEFNISDEYFTSPQSGSKFSDWKAFKGVITFPFDIFRIDDLVKIGDVTVSYIGDKKTAIYDLDASQWSVEGKTLVFTLPLQPDADDLVTVQFQKGVIFDVYGNPNAEFKSEAYWQQDFIVTKEMTVGTFSMKITYEDETIDLGNIFIIPAATEEKPNGLLFKNFYLEGDELEGYYDLDAGKVFIEDGQLVGLYTNSKGTTFGLVFYNAENETDDLVPVPFTIRADGSMEADAVWGIYAFNEDFSSPIGWFEIANTTKLTPVKSAFAVRKAFAGKALSTRKVMAPSKRASNKFVSK